MANVKISGLTAAASVADANEFEINEAGTSKKVTGAQISSKVIADIGTEDVRGTGALMDDELTSIADVKALNQGVGTGDSPQFAGVNVGHASDTTITRTGAGVIAVEGVEVTTNTGTQTLTNKTLTSPNINVTSDATGDIYYRTAGGAFARLGIGSTNEVLTVAAGLPSWAAGGGGGGSIDVQAFTASGTWTKPGSGTFAFVEIWGAGGGGGRAGGGDSGGGGGGGAYRSGYLLLSALGATETVTIGAGGTGGATDNVNGTAGGNSTFGSHLTGYGGGYGLGNTGSTAGGGGGGGIWGAGSNGVDQNTGGNGGSPWGPLAMETAPTDDTTDWGIGAESSGRTPWAANGNIFGGGGGGAAGQLPGDSIYGGGGGGGGNVGSGGTVGGDSEYGGGGGGGGASDTSPGAGAGGTSTFGGNGGAGGQDTTAGTNGTQPGGGGGGSESAVAGDGGDGYCRVTVF